MAVKYHFKECIMDALMSLFEKIYSIYAKISGEEKREIENMKITSEILWNIEENKKHKNHRKFNVYEY